MRNPLPDSCAKFVLPLLAGLLLSTCAAVPAESEAEVSLESLLAEMIDRGRLARLPDPAYTCRQASSFDPKSTGPDEEGWYANGDHSHYRRTEMRGDRVEQVLLDAEGPGAVVRWWVTSGEYVGTIRIYLDGAEEPAVEARVDELIGGEALVGAPLSAERARGRNLYLPIPYAQRCVITFDRPDYWETKENKDRLYYQINYRAYEAGTPVRSFSMGELERLGPRLSEVSSTLLAPADHPRDLLLPAIGLPSPHELPPAPSDAIGLLAGEGEGALTRISVRLEAEDLARALRSTILELYFDGEWTVWCPVGEFFGSGVGVNPYRGWYRTVAEDGTMTCYWVMPFRESYTVALRNIGDQPVTVAEGSVEVGRWSWDDRSMHFHAGWHQDREVETVGANGVDWNYVELSGRGVFAGDSLTLNNRVQAWWGEGDEKIWVDGEDFPSHFGTGTEDYYGYAWCTPHFFEAPFHAQPRAEGPRNYGHVTNSRTRALDAIPFTSDLRFDMEIWHWAKTRVDYAITTYWYGAPGARSNRSPEPEEAAHPVTLYSPKAGFQILERSAGNAGPQAMAGYGEGLWHDDDQLWWTEAQPGDRLDLALMVEEIGTYQLSATMTRAVDYAIVQLWLDGAKLGEPIDLYNDGVVPTGPIQLGTHELEPGRHAFGVEILGANEKAVKKYMVGLDRILLQPE